ncbi:MAG: c-type cytochrome [Burkholderiales bacterium]|nr:c-type cytochrome [Burkholderiales bacterium]
MRRRAAARSGAVKRWWLALGAPLLALLLGGGALWLINFNDGVDIADTRAPAGDTADRIERGAYLARTGNCLACHTARGGAPGAGGLALATPYGTLYTSNLTPDDEAGIGRWSAAAFWRALHHGRSADGRLLYPAFPYTHTTLLTRADADALFSYFRSLPASPLPVPEHELRWPYSTQLALAVWRALYFRPGGFAPDPAQDAAWNRGAYLVRGVAHCSACHASRDRWGGADWRDLSGGLMAAQGWYAPSLLDAREAGLAQWPTAEIVRLLKTGKLYQDRCASCHGEQGEGQPGAYPPLASNRAVTLARTENLLQTLLYGGFGPATAGHPRPYGMPPFTQLLSDAEIAAVLSHIRASWGNQAPEVSPLDVHTMRAALAQTLPR